MGNVSSDKRLDESSARRIDREEGIFLLTKAPLGEVMRTAHELRKERHPENRVTFVYDTNPNYTNVCITRCRFCAFCRKTGDPEAYTLTVEELVAQVKTAADNGATTVLLQGGHNPKLAFNDWLAYIRAIRNECPQVHIHPFSPSEIAYMADREKTSSREILSRLKEEGIDTLPGGGAEILVDRVRSLISPGKISSARWLSVMEEAQLLGFRTTATMMFGHVETPKEIVEHLLVLRELQDRTGGFTSFIPWSFKPGASSLSEQVSRTAHPAQYVRIISVARIILDNFAHIQSSWFSENVSAGQLGLLAGADDFGGILIEENVLKETGFAPRATLNRVCKIIRQAGFTPARRDSYYQVVERYR